MPVHPLPSCVRSYLRVSTPGQEREGTSLEGQEQAHRRFCAAQGLPAPTFYIEVESASDAAIEKRDEQLRLQREARPGELVLVTVLDRWSRDVPHAVSTVRALLRRGVRWLAFEENLDPSTPEGDSMLTIKAWAAEQERKRITERTQGRKRALTFAGLYVKGQAPIGYRVVEKKLVVHGGDAAAAREIVRRYLAGEGAEVLARSAPLTEGRSTWTHRAILRLLHSRYLTGQTLMPDGTWRETHQPIIDMATWERVQATLVTRRDVGRPHGEGVTAVRLLRGLASCALCGRRIGTVYYGTKPHTGMSYVCAQRLEKKCTASHVHAPTLDALVASAALARVVELRHDLARPATPAPVLARADHAARAAKLAARRARVIDLAADGAITADDLRTQLARIEVDLAEVNDRQRREIVDQEHAARAADPAARVHLLADVKRMEHAWERLGVAERRRAVQLLAARIEVLPSTRPGAAGVVAPRIQWRSLAELLESTSNVTATPVSTADPVSGSTTASSVSTFIPAAPTAPATRSVSFATP